MATKSGSLNSFAMSIGGMRQAAAPKPKATTKPGLIPPSGPTTKKPGLIAPAAATKKPAAKKTTGTVSGSMKSASSKGTVSGSMKKATTKKPGLIPGAGPTKKKAAPSTPAPVVIKPDDVYSSNLPSFNDDFNSDSFDIMSIIPKNIQNGMTGVSKRSISF